METPETFPSPHALVARAAALKAECEGLKEASDLAAEALRLKNLEYQAAKAAIVHLGEGRYQDGEGHRCLVVAEVEGEQQPDDFKLGSPELEAEAREIAGERWKKLFDRHVYYTCKVGFEGAANAVLTPAKARSLLDLLRLPGKILGAKCAYLRWLK